MAGRRHLRIGILGQALAPLALGTVLVTVLATVAMYRQVATQRRDQTLRDILNHATTLHDHERFLFNQVDRQIIHCRRLLEAHLAADLPLRHAIPPTTEGSRRLLPGAGQPPLAAFITARAANDAPQIRAAGLATDLLADIGPAWTSYPSNLTIALPDRWLVGWGETPVALVESLLPDDPLLLPAERELLTPPGSGPVRWSRTFLEPASDHWLIAAGATTDLPGLGRAIIAQVLPAESILERISADQDPDQDTMVFDATDHLLAHSRLTRAIRESGGALTLARSRDPLLMRLRSVIPAAAEQQVSLVHDPAGLGWFGVSFFPEPGWTAVTFHPAETIDRQARAAARDVLFIGSLLLLAQAVLLVSVLRWRIAQPLRRLSSAATELAAGRRGIALDPTRQDEIGELSAAFASMSEAVTRREDDLRQALAALREREERAHALLASAADAVLLLVDDRIAEANPKSGTLFHCPESALLGLTFEALSPPRQADGTPSAEALSVHRTAIAASGSVHFPWRHRRQDGSEFEAEIGLAQVALPGPSRLLAVVRDVTERNRLQERLRQGEKMESLGQLAGGIAHDFNNMLTGILGSAELIKLCPPGSEQIRLHAETIITASKRSADLTRTLLTFARKGRSSTVRVDVHQIIRDAHQLLERSLDKRIRIALLLAADGAQVMGDPAQLQNVIINLTLNGRDAMPDGGALTIATANLMVDEAQAALLTPPVVPGRFIEITVRDTGTGIPPEILPRIFEPFFTTKTQGSGSGTGLGLASVYGTVRDHRGTIQVDSQLHVGTAFRIWLPLTTQEAATAGVPHPPTGRRRTGAILVVDDEAAIRANARMVLGAEGWEVIEARDGVDAVELFAREHGRIAAAIIDMEMPRMRGIDCLRELQRLDPQMVAVLCSGYIRDGSEEEMLRAGFCSILAKPYRAQDLIRLLDKAIALRQPQP